jgi:hypothetical protein
VGEWPWHSSLLWLDSRITRMISQTNQLKEGGSAATFFCGDRNISEYGVSTDKGFLYTIVLLMFVIN